MPARLLPQDLKQPGIGTVGVIGTMTAILLIIGLWAVPSTAQRIASTAPSAPLFATSPIKPPASGLVPRLFLAVPEAIRAPAGDVLTATAQPASPGRLVVFEVREGSAWTIVGSAREDETGQSSVRYRPRSFGAVEIRARIANVAESASVLAIAVRPNARVIRWREWIEKPAEWDRASFVAEVSRVLTDPRGWSATGEVVFEHTDSGTPGMWVKLATPRTTDRLCAPTRTQGIWNCRAGRSVVVNSDRWFSGRTTWPGTLDDYRGLIINHETGHLLGFGHRGCVRAGLPAPVMQQQGVSLEGCRANAWPLSSELARL